MRSRSLSPSSAIAGLASHRSAASLDPSSSCASSKISFMIGLCAPPTQQKRTATQPALMLMYPSAMLADLVDPLAPCADDGAPLPYEKVVALTEQRLAPLVAQHVDQSIGFGPEDLRWYWERAHRRLF